MHADTKLLGFCGCFSFGCFKAQITDRDRRVTNLGLLHARP